GIINKVLAGMIGDLNEKVNEILEFYNSHFPQYGPINQILLCGGGANIKGIDKIISKCSCINVARGDSLVNLGEAKDKFQGLLSETYNLDVALPNNKKNKSGSDLSITQDSSLTFATAIGLALRGIFVDKL
ncbi:MAG: hypothetical protein PHR36_02225, partial [Patescibacteria group bacterium]|nr:hypothetical protein [Patescibacteria group bacterium]